MNMPNPVTSPITSPTTARMVRALLCALLCAPGMSGCASSQHATGATGFSRQGDRVLVEVLLDEYQIHMPTTIPAGQVTFELRNTGSHDHNIRISGHGIEETLPQNLKPGAAAPLTVALEPGTYKVDCPIGPHATLGMRLKLTVTE